MGVADDIIARTDVLASARSGWETEWKALADYCLPSASRSMENAGSSSLGGSMALLMNGPSTKDASRKRFDSTAISAIDRLAAGMESLVSPQDEKWQTNKLNDPLGPAPTDEEQQWLERLRDFQFDARYLPMSGFGNANQKYIRSIVTFGTGVIFCEEGFGKGPRSTTNMPFLYQHIPLAHCFIGCDAQGNADTLFRRWAWSARQLVQKFGDKCSAKVREMADNPRRQDDLVTIIHGVCPREEMGSRAAGVRGGSAFASYYVEMDGRHLIGDSGYFEFPFGVGYWIQSDNSGYGESPAMAALDDIRGLNVSRRSSLTAQQQWVKPPLAAVHDGVMNRPNLNPGHINFGAIDENGRLKIQPIITAQNPGVVQAIIQDQRNDVKELLYNNLFQILVQNPQMTAHEAMLRAAEKGDLLGPNGVKIQQGYAAISDREFGILERKGAFEPGATLEPPESLADRSFGVKFASPLDRLRESKEGVAIERTYQSAAQIAAATGSPEIFDNFDDDKAIKRLAQINGMPMAVMKTKEDRDAVREARAQQQSTQQSLAMAGEAAKAAKDGVPALQGLQDLMGGGQPNTAPLPLPALAPVEPM